MNAAPGVMPFHYLLWGALANLHDFRGATEEAGRFHALLGYDDVIAAMADVTDQVSYQTAMRRAGDLLVARAETSYVSPYWIAVFYAQADDRDNALGWLERAFTAHRVWMPTIRNAPLLVGLRNEPRFQDLVAKVGLPE